ncbi:MerR family transcriptional regulator [Streptomyces sp. SID8359]|uniref:MerR family transcriptional regulator n=1 Tax=Streptomyces sp. SID8359 TaxID=2690343 RepID=UPI00049108F5|nr:MerR family transcriptional regulator [Streptomyces sp. SolWspMP-sol2th]MYT95354.1 MerR family transcriptional regulator [Streptomyces sp. SID8359]
MRIGELSRRSGVPVPTIKYYVRERLLPAGELTSPNQAEYGPGHERRLRLIRVLLEVGGLSLATIGEVLKAADDPAQPVLNVLGAAAKGVTPLEEGESGPELEQARKDVAELLRRRDWQVSAGTTAAESLAGVISALRRVGHGGLVDLIERYADAAESVARADIGYVQRRVAREDLVESVVVGTVLGEAMFGALRRLAHEDVSFRLYEGLGAGGGQVPAGDGGAAGASDGAGGAGAAGG